MGKTKVKKIEVRFGLGRVEADLEIKEVEMTPMCAKNGGPIMPHHNKFQRGAKKGEVCFHLLPPGGVFQCRITATHRGKTEVHTPELILNTKDYRWNWKGLPSIFDPYYQIAFHTASGH